MNVWQHVQLMLKVDDLICIIMIEVYLGLLCFILAFVVTAITIQWEGTHGINSLGLHGFYHELIMKISMQGTFCNVCNFFFTSRCSLLFECMV
jgi:uncharacterized membrane protein